MTMVQRLWSRLYSDRAGMAGLAIVAVFTLLALGVWFGLLGQDWAAANGARWEPAGPQYWFGTNVLGQDIFERS